MKDVDFNALLLVRLGLAVVAAVLAARMHGWIFSRCSSRWKARLYPVFVYLGWVSAFALSVVIMGFWFLVPTAATFSVMGGTVHLLLHNGSCPHCRQPLYILFHGPRDICKSCGRKITTADQEAVKLGEPNEKK